MLTPTIERFQTLPHPALLGLSKKSAPDAEEKAMRLALIAAKGCDWPLPVLLGKRIIGWVRGRNFPDPATFYTREKMYCGFATYDALISALTSGSKFSQCWCKTATTAPVAGNWYDDWVVAGMPVPGAVNGTALTATVPTDATTGALFHGGNVASPTKHLISASFIATAGTPLLMLYDRLLVYDQCGMGTSTVSQNLTNSNTMSRYISAPTGGAMGGKLIVAVGPTLTGAASANFSALTYTDDAGNGSISMPTAQTPYIIQSAAIGTTTLGARIICPSLTAAGTVLWSWCMPTATGDCGMRSIQNYTITHSSQTGNFSMVLIRPLAILPIGAAAVASMMDMVMQVANLERIVDGAALSFLHFNPAGTTGGTYTGTVDMAWA